jgi:hypothetical protein
MVTEIQVLDETIVVPDPQPGIITYDNRRYLVTGTHLVDFQKAVTRVTEPTWYRLGSNHLLIGPGIMISTTVFMEGVTAFEYDLRAEDPTAFGLVTV